MKIKTAYDLKYAIQNARTETHFFTRKTMQFFGDTMRNYGVKEHDKVYELYRRKPVKHGLDSSAYFDKETFERVHNYKE